MCFGVQLNYTEWSEDCLVIRVVFPNLVANIGADVRQIKVSQLSEVFLVDARSSFDLANTSKYSNMHNVTCFWDVRVLKPDGIWYVLNILEGDKWALEINSSFIRDSTVEVDFYITRGSRTSSAHQTIYYRNEKMSTVKGFDIM